MSAYAHLAPLYDRLMDDFDYPAWADHYLALLELAGVHGGRLCECACGTGAITLELAQKGAFALTGVDISGEMLSIAQRKARERGLKIPFVRQDMCALELPRRVDALLCTCDGVNYLTDEKRLQAFLRRAKANLKPGGALAFDISTEEKLCRILGDNFFGEEREDCAYLWWNHYDDKTRSAHMELTFFTRGPDGRYERTAEEHIQRAWREEELREALIREGFENIRIFGGFGLQTPKEGDLRIHILANNGRTA